MPDLWAVLTNYGPMGIMLGWFMFKFSGQVERVDRSIDRLTRTHLLHIISSRPSGTIRAEAEQLLKELDDKQGVVSLRRRV